MYSIEMMLYIGTGGR